MTENLKKSDVSMVGIEIDVDDFDIKDYIKKSDK